jgi:aarF domain-containing kinase
MAPKPFNFPAKRTTAIFLLTATAATAAVATANSDNLSPFTADKIRAQIHGIVRTTRAVSTVSILLTFFNSSRCPISLIPLSMFQVASTVVDYEFSLRGLQKHSDQYHQAISQVNVIS